MAVKNKIRTFEPETVEKKKKNIESEQDFTGS